MHLVEFGQSSATIKLSVGELRLFNNALNEVCNGVRDLEDDGEFVTRLGVTREKAKRLLAEVHELIEQARRLPE